MKQQVKSGRLSLSLWRPSGVSSKDKFYFEIVVDYVMCYKSPPMQNKKPEWGCNVACYASLDSLIIIRLYKGAKAAPEKCHVRLQGLQLGQERASSLEYADGVRQQVTLLPLDFGDREQMKAQEKLVDLDAPNVCDIIVQGLHDLRLGSTKSVVLQTSYSEQAMRGPKVGLEPDRADVSDIQFDCTFRLCAAQPKVCLMVMQGDSFPGEVLCGCRLNIMKLAQSTPMPCFVALRDKLGNVRAFVQLRLSMSSPLRGTISHYGPPLMGIPLRLDWGDVVFFNTKTVNAQLVSAATASSWDHCGIVYEEDGKFFLLEAVSGGVQAPELNSRILDALAAGSKVCFRRLNLQRSPELKAELWSYAVGMSGRSYKKNIGQLVGSRWGRNKADDLSSVFCSELVAAGFKHLGLLGEEIITSNVLPKDIASSDFVLKRGSLGPCIYYSTKLHNLLQQSGKRSSEIFAPGAWIQTEESSFDE
jgi:hypothetical protein